MTSGRAPGGPSRGADAPTRTTGTRDGIGAIVAILALGLVFRLIIAQLNPGSGFRVDLALVPGRGPANLAEQGLHGFYDRPFFHDYTPGYLYVLYLVGLVGQQAGHLGDLIKIPPILSDVAIGWLVWSMAREIGGGEARRRSIGAALVVANPVTWFDSVLWGQVDSFGVVFLLLGLRELWRDQPERAAIWTVIAALIKPQLAILGPDRRGRDDPAGALAAEARSPSHPGTAPRRPWPTGTSTSRGRRLGSSAVPRLGAPDRPPDPDPHDRARRLPDRGRPVLPVRAVGHRARDATASSSTRG